jgi:hypothetical protein
MDKNIAISKNLCGNQTEKKVGNKTYIVTFRFNGDERVDISSTLVRLIRRELAAVPGEAPLMGA